MSDYDFPTRVFDNEGQLRTAVALYDASKVALDERQARYDEECRQWHEQGYRPHYCIHGANMWVEWDCICPWCEESIPDEVLAIHRALDALTERQERMDHVIQFLGFIDKSAESDTLIPRDIRTNLLVWTNKPVHDLLTVPAKD